jgi:hypothetical protein
MLLAAQAEWGELHEVLPGPEGVLTPSPSPYKNGTKGGNLASGRL